MKIVPNQDFKHGEYSYSKGTEYEVDDEDAEYFTACGWVGDQPKTGNQHFLDVHDGVIGHSSEVN